MKKAFTMVELIFVIVVLGILASVALPRLAANKEDAEITKIKAQVASIRAGIQTKRNANLLQASGTGQSGYPTALDDTNGLFGGVIATAIPEGAGWEKISDSEGETQKKYKVSTTKQSTTFTYYPTTTGDYKAGSFDCNSADKLCQIINQ